MSPPRRWSLHSFSLINPSFYGKGIEQKELKFESELGSDA